ncbi:MAG TPA: hypothetical protein VFQ11_01005, partial [Nocardioidaceae bacterium]|nr:hypothetical protein [Nocardioidaceae bacterium]
QREVIFALASILTILATTLTPQYASADSPCRGSGGSARDYFSIHVACVRGATRNHRGSAMATQRLLPGGAPDSRRLSDPPGHQPYRLLLSCEAFGTAQACAPKSSCEIRRSLVAGFWGAQPGACATGVATPVTAAAALTIGQAPPPLPQVTPGLVLTAFREIGLPALEARTQPEDKTLVNFATIFYTAPQPFSRTVTLLGRQVQVTATPSVFIWHYGDGTTATTTTPGAPYPAKDVTHDYMDAHVTVHTSVDVTYSGRFRVDGGPWQTIPGTVTITGPTAPLRVSEATPLLSGNHQ